jgi:uncharacterized protein YdcH (DUF465 family)
MNDTHYKLFDAYNEMEDEVQRKNTNTMVVTACHAHKLIAKLLFLKEEIYAIFRKE